ncbi:MAG: transglutaminase-like domain-containing protein [Spirochaetota bacterium]
MHPSNFDEARKANFFRRIRGKEQSFLAAWESLSAGNPQTAERNRELRGDMLYLMENMLLGDLAWLDGLWLKNFVEDSREIMDTVPWQKTVPPEIYRHFVLPFRVNNDNIDYERKAFFARLWPRVATLNMEEAVLAVNMFCYEEVRYIATDIRTAGPGSLLRRGLGRCGEQSVLLVSLLRAIGIPARQCYISRWSHTESNHAWVEAWTGKSWHYLGACEPEPVLNRGWFSENLKRAVLVQTRGGGGAYENYALEPVLARKDTYSIVNLTAHYTPTADLRIQVRHKGKPVSGARAQISVFNGGEFFPLHRFCTGPEGFSEPFAVGLGDVLLEAEWQGLHYWQIHNMRAPDSRGENVEPIVCELGHSLPQQQFFQFNPAPPAAPPLPAPENPDSLRLARHQRQMQAGETAYQNKIAAFQTEVFAQRVVGVVGVARVARGFEYFPETQEMREELVSYFQAAGNGAAELYQAFIQLFPRFGMDLWCLLKVLSIKERAFVSVFDLEDFLDCALRYKESYADNIDIWREYVLAPQVDFERVTAHRGQMCAYFADAGSRKLSIPAVFQWVETHIENEAGHSFFYYRSALSPLESFSLRRADPLSKKVLQVALLRMFGHAARLNPSLLLVEWWSGGEWLREAQEDKEDSARLFLGNWEHMPEGTLISLGLRGEDKLSYQALYCGEVHAAESQHGEQQGLARLLESPLPAGAYRICLGWRNERGNVSTWVDHFSLEEQQQKHIELPLGQNDQQWPVLAVIEESLVPSTGRPMQIYIAGDKIDEPFYHLLHDISNNALCRKAQLLFGERAGDEEQKKWEQYFRRFESLPPVSFISPEQARALERALERAIEGWETASFPKMLLLKDNQVVFYFCGYSRSAVYQLAGAIKFYGE